MQITIDLSEETVTSLERIARFTNVAGEMKGVMKDATIEDVIKGAISMYISWLSIEKNHDISSKKLKIKTNIPQLFKEQGRTQSVVSKLSNISQKTLSEVWNGGTPNLSTFLKLWILLGKPPIEDVLLIEPA